MNMSANKSAVTDSLRANLSDLNVMICAEPNPECDLLVRELQRTRAAVARLWPLPTTMSSETDVLFCEYMSDLAARLPWNPGEPRCALVVLLPNCGRYDPSVLYNCSPGAVLYHPFQPYAILTALLLARGQYQYERRLRARIERLEENLRLLREVERAKLILMERERLTEQEAHRRMRSLAMEKRVSLAQLACQIVDSAAPLR